MEHLIGQTFRLDGDALIRLSTGKAVRIHHGKYTRVFVARVSGRRVLEYAHRIIFFLHNGYLPEEVDHRDRDKGNQEADNLRSADRTLQMHNWERAGKYPRGVYRHKGRNGRYGAKVQFRNKVHLLGTHDSPEDASKVVEEKLRELYGRDYSA